MDTTNCSRGWGKRCPAATSARCTCACGGKNHGNPAARRKAGTMHGEALAVNYRGPSWDDNATRRFSGAYVNEHPAAWPVQAILFRREPDASGAIGRGEASILLEQQDGTLVPLPHTLVNHSPTGLEFGYGGSGPADTALNILALLMSPHDAWYLHQQFKWHAVTGAQHGDRLAMADVRRWIQNTWADQAQAELREEAAQRASHPAEA